MVKFLNFVDTKVIEGRNLLIRKTTNVKRKMNASNSELLTVLGIIVIAVIILGLYLKFSKNTFTDITDKIGVEVDALFDTTTVGTPSSTP